ncbi:MAG: phosphatidylglycerophosphatase A [Candidatus Omnitrophota bacterium]
MSNNFIRLVSTFFYIGYLPAAPGTAASVAGAVLYVLLSQSLLMYLTVTSAIIALGFYVSGKMEDLTKQKDPSCIVIDEVAGILITFFMLPMTFPVVITGFFLFRAFDMFKIYPVNKFEELGGGVGIMMDDLFAGLYANLTMQAAIRIAGIV